MAKTFKPGQLITVNHVVYRVRRTPPYYCVCANCAAALMPSDSYEALAEKSRLCYRLCRILSSDWRIPDDCYVEKVKVQRDETVQSNYYSSHNTAYDFCLHYASCIFSNNRKRKWNYSNGHVCTFSSTNYNLRTFRDHRRRNIQVKRKFQ